MQSLQALTAGYQQAGASEFPVPSSGKVCSGRAANRTTSRACPTAKAACARRTAAAAARPSSQGALKGHATGAKNGCNSQRRGARQASPLASAGSLVAGNGSRPSTPEQTADTSPAADRSYGAEASPVQLSKRTAHSEVAKPLVTPEMRADVRTVLADKPFLRHTDELFMHGRAYSGPTHSARVTWKSDKPPRKDHDTPAWLTATEFEDAREVSVAKCRQLASLMRLSKKTVLYTGAGISASVIGQAALSGQNKVGWKPDKMTAKPTLTHHALGFLGRQGLIHSWVQQNHDGLPQKAGFPQECINEIHGSWYDPSNPVVKYSGSLHQRSYPWMTDDAQTADLVLVLGTSLGGLNADQVATEAAERSALNQSSPRGALGTVCINLQQTAEDGKMTLRLFGKSDDLLPMLLQELGFEPLRCGLTHWPRESRALVPYDSKGKLVVDGAPKMWLDLSEGAKVCITAGHNIQGAKQPQYMHIGAKKPFVHNGITKQPGQGLGKVMARQEDSASFNLVIDGAQMRLGLWWLDAAMRGAVEVLPVVNINPAFEDSKS